MTEAGDHLTAIVLAGDRSSSDPLLAHAGTPCKAVIEIAGRAMVLRVLDALADVDCIDEVILSGPQRAHLEQLPELRQRVDSGALRWVAPENSPSSSAFAAAKSLPGERAVMLTTADHPLLSAEVAAEFCRRSLETGADVTVGLAPYELVREAFPELKKTVLRFRDGDYCGCNLFSFLTRRGRQVAEQWRAVEAERKNPRKIISLLGLGAVIRYRLGLLSLDEGLDSLSARLGLDVAVVVLPYAEAAVDVDSASDHLALEQRLVTDP